jgi:ferrous iron transport protein A
VKTNPKIKGGVQVSRPARGGYPQTGSSYPAEPTLTRISGRLDNGSVLQPSFKRRSRQTGLHSTGAPRQLTDLLEGEKAILDRLDVPEDMARRLMEMGFLPGTTVEAARCAPGGDPRVFRVDGSEIALRSETAARLYLKL